MSRKLICLAFMSVLTLTAVRASADWVAYNDLSDGNGGTTTLGLNVTTHTYLDTNKALMDFDTGATLPVTITMEIVGDNNANGDVYPNNGDNCNAGTDADKVFGGILDLTGGNELDGASTSEHKAIIFNGLSPGMSYTITLTSNRGDSGYTNRWTRVTIEGADAYTYAASAGVKKLSEESGEFCVGYNTVTGYVMKWTDISCGADGSFSIKSQNADYGAKGYAMMAFRLEEFALAGAADPSPADGATDVPRDMTLSWTPGIYAPPINGHTVYFSESFTDVNDAVGGVTQDANSYTPPQRLDLDKTYYWRVDEVNGPPDFTVHPGEVWQFTTEPFVYPVASTSITATASSQFNADTGPENTINGSGLDDNDLHSKEEAGIWLSSMIGQQPTWIQYEFDRVYKLHQMWVWNHNTSIEPVVGFGIKDATIEYSIDGANWTTLGTTHEFARAPGLNGYAHNTTVDLGAVPAKYVKLTANSNWGGIINQYGLSEVRFFHIPVFAREPAPDSGATDVDVDNVALSWRAGREAASHHVYFSTDKQAVIDETISPVSIPAGSSYANYATGPLVLGQSYYWKVNEVNEAKTPTTWQGDVWDFGTQEYLVVDDIEDYNDFEPDRIFDIWIDGWDVPENGSLVGSDVPPFAEQTIVHSGKQSMSLHYNNTAGATYSEAERTFAAPQNWTEHGVKTLSLWFSGAADNVAGQMYVKVNGSKVTYDGNASNLTLGGWQVWNIELASFGMNPAPVAGVGVNLQSVTRLGIGIDGNGASGTLYFDDIRLYPYDRQFITPTEPPLGGLIGHWKFDGDTQDYSGLGNHGTAGGNPTFVAGKVGSNALELDGDDYVAIDGVVDDITSTDITLSIWIKTTQVSEGEVFAANDSASDHPFMLGVQGGNPYVYDGSDRQFPPAVNDGQWHMLTYVRSGNTGYIYVDGVQRGTYSAGFNLGSVTRWSIGQEWDGSTPSNFYTGTVDNVHFYDRVLSQEEIAWLAGWTEPFDKPF